MFAIVEAAGWPIWPLLLASVIAVAIIIERAWSLRAGEINPPALLAETLHLYRSRDPQRGLASEQLNALAAGSPLGQVFATALHNAQRSREIMKESVEETGRAVAHELDRFLNTLGTVASMAPLLGLLGTVVGMIEIFGAQTGAGGGNPEQLAHGISIALYNTAFGLIVAIPAIVFHRYYKGKVDALVVEMEQQAIKLIEIVHGERGA